MEKIGLESIFKDAGFQAGAEQYNRTIDQVNQKTGTAAAAMSKGLAPASGAAGKQMGQTAGNITTLTSTLGGLVNATGVGASSFNMLTTAMQMAGNLGAVFLAVELGKVTWQMGEAGAQTLRTRAAFYDLARQAGGAGDEIVAAVQEATDATVSGGNIMAAVNRGILLGLGANAEQWGQLAEVARFRSRAMGISMTQALDDIATGIGRESRLILDNLGIIVDTDAVTEAYARTLGKTADQLSAAERKQAIMNEVIRVGQAQIAAAGGLQEDYADQFAQLDVAMASLSTTMKVELAPAVADLAGDLVPLVEELGTLYELIGGLKGAMGGGLTGLFGGLDLDQIMAGGLRGPLGWLASLKDAEEDAGRAADSARYVALAQAYAAEQASKAAGSTDEYAKALETVDKAQRKAIASASERMVDAEEKAGAKREDARKQLLDKLAKEERAAADKVAGIMQDLAEVQAELQDDLKQAAADAARERVKLAEEMADDIAEAEQDLQERLADAQEEFDRDQARERADHLEEMLRLERDYNRDVLKLKADFERDMAQLERDRAESEADIRERYKEARIQELVRLGYDEAEIRANWTDDMLAGPLKDQMDKELAALQEQYAEEAADLKERLEQELAEREAAYKERQAEQDAAFAKEQAERKEEYDRQLEEMREAHKKELEAIATRNREALEAIAERLEEEKARLREAAAQQAQHLQDQLDEERKAHEAREAELKQANTDQLTEIDQALADELTAIRRALGLQLKEIVDNTEGVSKTYRDSYTQQLLDLDQYYRDRLARDAQYQNDLQDLFGAHSASRWMIDFGQSLRQGLDIGFTMPSMSAGAASQNVVNNRTVNLTMPTTVNNGMDVRLLQQTILQTVTQAIRN